jgi:hypothetical protein
MTYENALRNFQSAPAINSGLHLVYSRDWPQDRRMRALALQSRQPIQPQKTPQSRINSLHDNLYFAAEAFIAPFARAGHALLKVLHVR